MNEITLDALNAASPVEFIRLIGPTFEHSPWVAEAAVRRRPFASRDDLHNALCDAVREAGQEQQVALISAHPDLVGRAALAGELTTASTSEQASAGLDKLSASEIEQFQNLNAAYKKRFGFPFVICARLNKKEAILRGFDLRLTHSREQEIQTALGEIYKIAYLRLQDIVAT